MGVRSLRDRGGRNFLQGDLTSRKIMDYAIRPIQRAGRGGGGGAVRLRPIQRAGGGGGGGVLSAVGRFNERGGGVLSASGRFNERGGGGGGGAVRLRPIQRERWGGGGGRCCPRKVNSSGVINKYLKLVT